ncbi:MAG: PKD domain-containing protein, partial [Acidobacteria bacterium]|nr:PKD domain-containing protein [Candidatus Sulfomarinibacter sp. MAG AM2]
MNFTDTSTGLPTSWFWDFDDSLDSTAQNPMHTFFVAGDYDVELTVSNLGGLDSRIVKVTVFEDVQSPEASFFFLPTNPTVGQFVNFFDTSGGGPVDSWEWAFGDGDTSSEQYPGHQFASEGAYDVSLTVTNSAGETSTQQTVNVGAEIPPIDPDFDEIYFVPSASHAGGAEGSFWVTDMDVNNAGDDIATYKLAWLPRKADNSNPAKSEEFTLEPGEAVRIEDVVLSVFDIVDGFGALAVVSDSRDLFIFSRTYNDADIGTFGTAVPGVNEKDLIEGNTRKRLLFFTEDGDFRSNIAFQNGTGSNLRVSWERYLADGTMVESGTTDLAPYSNKQLNAVYQDEAPIEAAYMDVWTDTAGGKFMVFSSVVDNGTSDG